MTDQKLREEKMRTKWEYHVQVLWEQGDDEIAFLKNAGEEGWQLVAVDRHLPDGIGTKFYFKREIERG